MGVISVVVRLAFKVRMTNICVVVKVPLARYTLTLKLVAVFTIEVAGIISRFEVPYSGKLSDAPDAAHGRDAAMLDPEAAPLDASNEIAPSPLSTTVTLALSTRFNKLWEDEGDPLTSNSVD